LKIKQTTKTTARVQKMRQRLCHTVNLPLGENLSECQSECCQNYSLFSNFAITCLFNGQSSRQLLTES